MEEERPRAGRKRSEASRQAIFAAALELLRLHGYGKVTTDAIAARAGVGKQTMYRWWPTKADVVLDAMTDHARTIEAPETGSLEGDLAAFLTATFRLLHGPQGTAAVLKGLMAEAQLDQAFAKRFAIFIGTRRDVLGSVLRRHVNDRRNIAAAVDMAFGALWYRLLVGHGTLDRRFALDVSRLLSTALA